MKWTADRPDIFDRPEPVKLFTLVQGISPRLLSPLTRMGLPTYDWVDDPATADYFVFGINYEVAHDPHYFRSNPSNGDPSEIPIILQFESALQALANRFQKKLIIVYFNDDASPISIDNSIIFRTSIIKSRSHANEHCIPVLKQDLSLQDPAGSEWLPWTERPSIGFRGQALAGNIKASRVLRNQANLLANRLGGNDLFDIHKNFGYLVRKNAMDFLRRSRALGTDFFVSSEKDMDDTLAQNQYSDNVFRNPYTLCVSGFGNYSYRLYETLSAGRIPVFINTDCKLPFEEFIDWRQHLVWVEKKDIPHIEKKLLSFHQRMKGDAFVALQQSNKALYENYLSPNMFFSRLSAYL